MVGQPGKAIVIDRNRSTARRLGRVLTSAGYQVDLHEEPARLEVGPVTEAAGPVLLVAEAACRSVVLEVLGRAAGPPVGPGGDPPTGPVPSVSGVRYVGVLYGAGDELDGTEMLAGAGFLAILGCRGGTAGRLDLEGELLSVARHVQGWPLPPLQAYLLWGAQAYHAHVVNLAGREAATARLVALCGEQLATSRRLADAAGEVVHELITNALYDAPVDEKGQARYAHDRTAAIELGERDRVSFRYACDGLRLAVEVEDRFGRLGRADLLGSLRRGTTGQVKRGAGGAGIGLSVVFRACQTLQIDVAAGQRTRVTAVLDIEPGQKDAAARTPLGRSLIFSHGSHGSRGLGGASAAAASPSPAPSIAPAPAPIGERRP